MNLIEWFAWTLFAVFISQVIRLLWVALCQVVDFFTMTRYP